MKTTFDGIVKINSVFAGVVKGVADSNQKRNLAQNKAKRAILTPFGS